VKNTKEPVISKKVLEWLLGKMARTVKKFVICNFCKFGR
jgi:hypothetical protein